MIETLHTPAVNIYVTYLTFRAILYLQVIELSVILFQKPRGLETLHESIISIIVCEYYNVCLSN